MTVTLTEEERFYVSLALSQLVDSALEVPELDLSSLLELNSKFLMPEDIAF